MLDPQTIELLRQLGYDPTLVERVLSAGLWITLATVLAAIPTGIIARRRGRSVVGWVLLALSLPLIPLLLVYRLPAQKPEQPAP
ncbi:MAG: hypothetical protein IPH08_02035 [Rhodocyclaceae bacterium]|jgi:hypothetical protein|nr:hypothetical protein [Rhodocyclaceae bacterium]MBK6905946.1 hypothetical protein [Rhodocyclaceae bacterium]